VTEENRASRVAEAIPALHTLVRHAQDRFKVLQSDTALVGFSQGAIMALEFSVIHDGNAGRVLAFSGRFAKLPEKAPELTTLHLLHGEDDRVIPVQHAYAAYERLMHLQGDATLDIDHPLVTRSMPHLPIVPFIACRHVFHCAAGSMR
jgi:phospholipase/carboxylesterase